MIIPAMRAIPLLLLAALALSACKTLSEDKHAGEQTITPTAQFPLHAEAHPDEIRLAVHAGGLSHDQGEALIALANRWLDAGSGAVTIQVPTRGADIKAANQDSAAAQSLLVTMGVPSDHIQRVGYDPQDGAAAPLVVGFAAYEAVVPACGKSWENLSNNTHNTTMTNFGCAVQANLAAQIANPADLAGPRPVDPPDAMRRAVVLSKYHQGEVTTAAKDQQASGAISAKSSN